VNSGRDVYSILLSGVNDAPVLNITIGINWTLVETADGCGLAQTPRRDAPGCQPVRNAGTLAERGLERLAALMRSDNPLETSLGVAAINAHHNRYSTEGPDLNGLDAFRDIDGLVAVVGRFPNLDRHLNNYCVIEREPREGEFGEGDMAKILPTCEAVVITAATLANGSAGRIIELAENARKAFVGPGTPLAPALISEGIECLAGMVIDDAARARTIIGEGGAVAALKNCGRFVTMMMP
jgi:uncharacterized protein (DUF4213/DUF364 family)